MISRCFKRNFSSVGQLWTWGETTFGWGRYQSDELRTPGKVEGFNDVSFVSTGPYHMLFKTAADKVYCTGYGKHGRLGNGSTENVQQPVELEQLFGRNVTQLAAGDRHSLALTQSGNVYSWGYGGRYFQNIVLFTILSRGSPIGQGESGNVFRPKLIEHPEKFTQVTAGSDISLAVGESGLVYGWGSNVDFNRTSSFLPVQLEQVNFFLEKYRASVVKMESVGNRAFFLLDNGRLYVAGENMCGVFGTRVNPRVLQDGYFSTLTKVVDEDYKNEKIVDFKVSYNSLIFRTDSDAIYYSGMKLKYRPTRFQNTGPVKQIFATNDSVGVIEEDGRINFINDAFIGDSIKKGDLITSLSPSLKNALTIGGTHKLRYALVGL